MRDAKSDWVGIVTGALNAAAAIATVFGGEAGREVARRVEEILEGFPTLPSRARAAAAAARARLGGIATKK